jgi:fatty-acyl-CoA synthase
MPDSYRSRETFHTALISASSITTCGYTFLREDGGSNYVCYADVCARAKARAVSLREQGIRAGDRVALVIDDNEQFVITFFACVLARLIPVPMYPPFTLGRLDRYLDTAAGILQSAGAAALITTERLKLLLWPLAARATTLRVVASAEQLQDRAGESPPSFDVQPDDLAFLQFTSGSTAAPKGVMVTHRSLVTNTRAIVDELIARPREEDVGLSWLPLYHDMGLIGFVIAPLFSLRSSVLMPALTFLKRPERWFQALQDFGATVTFAPNFAYAVAVKRIKPETVARWDLSRVRVFGCGAEPARADTFRAFLQHFGPANVRPDSLLPCYGMAEATLAVTHHVIGRPWRCETVNARRLHEDGLAVPRGGEPGVEFVSCGRPLAGHELRIVDDARRPLPERAVGEIELRGPSVTAGYFGDASATAKTFVDGWLRTGDLGFVADGDLFVSGRKKDLIIVAGRNYAPEEIEGVVAGVPGVRPGNVVAFAGAGARGTDDVVIVCEARLGASAEVATAVRARVADEMGLAVADVVLIPPGALPKTSSGKLQRARTRSLYLEGTLGRQGDRTPRGGAQALLLTRYILLSAWSRIRFLLRSFRWNQPSN